MKPFAFVLLGSLLLACGGGGGLSPAGMPDAGVSPSGIPEAEACQQAAVTFCKKIYGCQDPTSLKVQGVLMNEAACETTVLQNCGSTSFQCGEGMTYHPDQALVCKNEFNGQDCATLSAKIWIGVMMLSLSAATAALTADVPSCTTICSTP